MAYTVRMTYTDSNPFPVGSVVRVRPEHHREGEVGTVVAADPEGPRPRGWQPTDVAVAFASVSGLPLWYGPDELEPVACTCATFGGMGPGQFHTRCAYHATVAAR